MDNGILDGYTAGATLTCPAGKKAVGGGWTSDSLPGGWNAHINWSAPSPSGDAWITTLQNVSGGTINAVAYAVCITVTDG